MVINKRVHHFSDARLSWVIYIGFNRGKSAVSSSDKAKILTKILSESSYHDSSGMSTWVSWHSPSAKLACLFVCLFELLMFSVEVNLSFHCSIQHNICVILKTDLKVKTKLDLCLYSSAGFKKLWTWKFTHPSLSS